MQRRFTAVEAARAANVSEATIRNYIRAGRLVAEKDGTSWCITRDALESTFGSLPEIDLEEPPPIAGAGIVRSATAESVSTLLEAITRPMNDMLEVLREQLDAKDRRIAELESQVADLQSKLSSLTTQVTGQSTSQTQAWQEFLRIHTAQMASLTTQMSRSNAPTPQRKTGLLRRLFSS